MTNRIEFEYTSDTRLIVDSIVNSNIKNTIVSSIQHTYGPSFIMKLSPHTEVDNSAWRIDFFGHDWLISESGNTILNSDDSVDSIKSFFEIILFKKIASFSLTENIGFIMKTFDGMSIEFCPICNIDDDSAGSWLLSFGDEWILSCANKEQFGFEFS